MKDKIIEAAELVFWQRGFHGATIDDVISAAKTTPRTLYRHFASKQALAAAAIMSRSGKGVTGKRCQRLSWEVKLVVVRAMAGRP
jgi:AcrR family transcriptional regulator